MPIGVLDLGIPACVTYSSLYSIVVVFLFHFFCSLHGFLGVHEVVVCDAKYVLKKKTSIKLVLVCYACLWEHCCYCYQHLNGFQWMFDTEMGSNRYLNSGMDSDRCLTLKWVPIDAGTVKWVPAYIYHVCGSQLIWCISCPIIQWNTFFKRRKPFLLRLCRNSMCLSSFWSESRWCACILDSCICVLDFIGSPKVKSSRRSSLVKYLWRNEKTWTA